MLFFETEIVETAVRVGGEGHVRGILWRSLLDRFELTISIVIGHDRRKAVARFDRTRRQRDRAADRHCAPVIVIRVRLDLLFLPHDANAGLRLHLAK